MKKRISDITHNIKKEGIVIICIVALSLIAVAGLLIIDNQPEDNSITPHNDGNELSQEVQPLQTADIHLQDYQEALNEMGLAFINVTVYPHTTDDIDWDNPHIGRLSEDIPVNITSEEDVDLLLAIFRTVNEMGLGGLGWETCVDDAINEAGLEDYFMEGIREITRPAREQDMIYLATNHTFEELVEMGLFMRQGIMKDFHALGFFLDMPEDFETPIDDFDHGWVMDNEIARVALPDGYHSQFFLCGCTYEGYWENGLPNGLGKYTQPMMEGTSEGKAILEGYFIDGIAHGMVTYTRIWPDRTLVFEFEADMGYQIEDSVMNEEGIHLPARFPLVIHLVMDHYLATNENWQN